MKPTHLLGLALGASIAFSTAAFAQDISVAVAGPMTGSESAFGRQMKNGADMAVADLNAAGGVIGKKLALQIGDEAAELRLTILGCLPVVHGAWFHGATISVHRGERQWTALKARKPGRRKSIAC